MRRVAVDGGRSCSTCDSDGSAHLSSDGGLLASVIAAEMQDDTGCGTVRCPWLLEVAPGRVINLTLLDYGPVDGDDDDDAARRRLPPSLAYPSSESQCAGPRYAVVRERANPRETLVCGGGGGVRHVYTSISNQLEISVTGRDVLEWRAQFVIQYQGLTNYRQHPTDARPSVS